ncbi:MAG: hypothetical protein EPO10_04060, partial [Reyranella sp.]
MPTSSTNIPLSYVGVGGDQYRLAISVGINGGPLQSYLFDTGSPGFNAAYNPTTWNGFGGGSTTTVPASTIANGNNVQFCYGDTPGACRGFIGNIVQVPSLSFQDPTGGTTTFNAPPSGGFHITAVSSDNAFSQPSPLIYPDYFCSGGFACPGTPNPTPPDSLLFYGIFGAGAFTSPQVGCSTAIAIPATCPTGQSTPPVTVGSPLGQIQVANSHMAQGYMVAANGQANQATAGGISNPPSGNALVSIGGNSNV